MSACCTPVQLFACVGSRWLHNALRYHQLMPISCHFRNLKAPEHVFIVEQRYQVPDLYLCVGRRIFSDSNTFLIPDTFLLLFLAFDTTANAMQFCKMSHCALYIDSTSANSIKQL